MAPNFYIVYSQVLDSFLKIHKLSIKEIDDKIIDYGIEKYYQGGHHNQGKGFPYLKKILQTLGQDNEAIKELERRRIGGVPPIIKIEEK